MKVSLVLAGILPVIATASRTIVERRNSNVARDWRHHAKAPSHHEIDLHIALASDGRAALEQHALEISDPSSPRWRQHLSPAEISEMLSPSNETIEAVLEWLRSAGIDGRHSHDTVLATATVGQAEVLLDTSYSLYQHTTKGKQALRTEHYSIPDSLRRHVDFVAPTVHFPLIHTRPKALKPLRKRMFPSPQGQSQKGAPPTTNFQIAPTAPKNYSGSPLVGPCGIGLYPNNTVTPRCIRAAYEVDWNVSCHNTSYAILNPDGLSFNNADLQKYLRQFNPAAARANITFPYFNATGASPLVNQTSPEIDIDTQLSMGLAFPARAQVINVDIAGVYGNWSHIAQEQPSAAAQARSQDSFLKFLHEMAYNDTVPPVVSLSAGGNEDFVPYAYAQRACSLFAASGARGVTWIVASGDSGPLAGPLLNHNLAVDPAFPASCPWVLAVGATFNPYNETAAECTAAGFTSGGGFSNYFARPRWQADIVPAYISQHVDPAFQKLSGFNASGRGIPDVAALGADVPIVENGAPNVAEGTSASAPLWAALVTLLNDYEESRGRPSLGLIAPWLYSLGAGGKGGELRDITVGDSSKYTACFPPGYLPYAPVGYNASAGWDAMTGLGVPVFAKLRAALG